LNPQSDNKSDMSVPFRFGVRAMACFQSDLHKRLFIYVACRCQDKINARAIFPQNFPAMPPKNAMPPAKKRGVGAFN
jgi:hypothetical protein